MEKPNQSNQFQQEALYHKSKIIEDKIKEQEVDQKTKEEVITETWKKISILLDMPGYKIIEKRLSDEMTNTYQQMANGSKDTFDEYKGKLKGLSFLQNIISNYKAKASKYNKSI